MNKERNQYWYWIMQISYFSLVLKQKLEFENCNLFSFLKLCCTCLNMIYNVWFSRLWQEPNIYWVGQILWGCCTGCLQIFCKCFAIPVHQTRTWWIWVRINKFENVCKFYSFRSLFEFALSILNLVQSSKIIILTLLLYGFLANNYAKIENWRKL